MIVVCELDIEPIVDDPAQLSFVQFESVQIVALLTAPSCPFGKSIVIDLGVLLPLNPMLMLKSEYAIAVFVVGEASFRLRVSEANALPVPAERTRRRDAMSAITNER